MAGPPASRYGGRRLHRRVGPTPHHRRAGGGPHEAGEAGVRAGAPVRTPLECHGRKAGKSRGCGVRRRNTVDVTDC